MEARAMRGLLGKTSTAEYSSSIYIIDSTNTRMSHNIYSRKITESRELSCT